MTKITSQPPQVWLSQVVNLETNYYWLFYDKQHSPQIVHWDGNWFQTFHGELSTLEQIQHYWPNARLEPIYEARWREPIR